MRRFFLRIILFVSLLVLGTTVGYGQRLCEALVENVMEQAGENCVQQDGELSCYAYDSLSATHFAETQLGSFINPGNIVELATLHTIQSASVDLEEDEWGVAYLQTRANLPSATADEATRLIMMGDVFMENSVEGGASATVGTVYITTNVETDLLEAPAATDLVVATVPSATVLEADALMDGGQWLRANNGGQVVWVNRDNLFPNDQIDGLPTANSSFEDVNASSVSAFGNLYFSTGGDSDCQEAPNMLVVQTPSGQNTQLTINDIPMGFGSTVAMGFNTVDGQDVMWITVIEGSVTLYPGSDGAVTIPEGHTTEASVSAPVGGQAILDKVTGAPIISAGGIPFVRRTPTSGFPPAVPLSPDGSSYKSTTYYNVINKLPENLLNYPVSTTAQPTPAPTDGESGRVDNGDGTVTISETICIITPVEGSGAITARVGPGTGRAALSIIEEGTQIEGATTVTAPDGSLWYEINNDSGLTYVSAEDVVESCEFVTRVERIACLLEVRPGVDQLWGYVGPGYNRNVSTFLDLTQTYEPIGRVETDGVPWFEVPVPDGGTLWVDGTMFDNLEGCDADELVATPPPIVATAPPSNATRIPLDPSNSSTQAFVPDATQQEPQAPAPTATSTPDFSQPTPTSPPLEQLEQECFSDECG